MEQVDQAAHAQRIWNGIHETYRRLQTKPEEAIAPQNNSGSEPHQEYLPDTMWRIPVIKKSDDQLYSDLCFCVFNAGIKGSLLDSKWPGIAKAFAGFRVDEVAAFPQDYAEVILTDPTVLRNRRKITGCLKNALEVGKLRHQWGSFAIYLTNYAQEHGPNALSDDIQARFSGIGPATGPQFLKDLGFDMFKADAHVRNILYRTGLITSKNASAHDVSSAFGLLIGAESERTGRRNIWLSSIDWILYCFGIGEELEHPVCKPGKPLCDECGASPSCPKNGVK
ncbi:MAG: DNA-3-methyladenine glycosylase I [Candidatus Eisenbacteria bacterium]